MKKKPSNHGKPVTQKIVGEIRDLAEKNTPTRIIALKTGRTESAVYGITAKNKISLKPTNQSPYGTGSRLGKKS